MATVIVNNPVTTGVIYPAQYTSVWVKPYYTAPWQYVPYLFPDTSTEASAPSDSEASLSWNYGKYVNLWGNPGDTLLPVNLENWHVRILVHTHYGTYIAWIGVVVGEQITERGIDVETGLPRGEQILECRGLEYLLERRVVIGTYVGDDENVVYLPRTRTFNDTNSRRESLAGNRSAVRNQLSGTFLFSSDGNKWSNYDIIQYLLAAFQPWVPIGQVEGQVEYARQFALGGQTEGLRYIFEEHRLHGRTVREALNALIDRKRGMGWKIRTDGVGRIYIWVFSLAQVPVVGNNAYIPANPRQINVPLHDDKFIKAKFRISSTSQVDYIVVESESPIKTCATVRFSDGSLEPAWAPDLDTEFELSDPLEIAYRTLADELLTNWDAVHLLTYYPLVQFSDFSRYADVSPTNFAFLLAGSTDPPASLLAGFNVLDVDGDGALSKEDLGQFAPQNTYQVATEEERATDKYATVFSHFQVPRAWNWAGWTPSVSRYGVVDPTGQGAYWTHDTPFERFLPFIEPGSALGTEREYLEPFACLEVPQRLRDILLALANAGAAPYTLSGARLVDPTITNGEFEDLENGFGVITWDDLYQGLIDYPADYFMLDRASQRDFPTCNLRMGDSGMRLIIKSKANHIFALNHEFGGAYEDEPEFDYRSLIATVFFETDMMPRVVLPIWTNVFRDPEGNIVRQSSPIGKMIFIEVPGKEVWMVAPWTVTGLDGTDLEFFQDGEPGIVRDDTPDLRFVAELARLWYGQQRASMDMHIANQHSFFQNGDLIVSAISGWRRERVGTCVTAIMRDYQAGTHQVTTGYGELDPAAFGGELR